MDSLLDGQLVRWTDGYMDSWLDGQLVRWTVETCCRYNDVCQSIRLSRYTNHTHSDHTIPIGNYKLY